ncbi:lipid-A-disaccharide synthase [Ketogulonicigenium vulgare]|uniref:lipid-A-disaccharide synthase n=1 Tax=Ketogulonicigenium vulgare TaxID=92945 RepID=UPI00235A46B5|nr:lipid-A-disaccharide synthase [Ketogulonicigenium vulgare]
MRVFIIAGEVSGDMLGGAVMAGLRSLRPDIEFAGIGGAQMQAQGLQSQFPMSELSVMGIAEVLPKYFHLKRRIREAAAAAIAFQPDILLTIDSPDFSLRVAKIVRAAAPQIRNVHYVAPSVWAWRPKRAQKMAKVIDHVLALLPFEPPYMTAAGMDCDFVGHPIATLQIAPPHETPAGPLVLVLPGSRRGEVERLSERFGAAIALFAADHPDARFILPMAVPVADLVREKVASWPVQPELVLEAGAKAQAFRDADLALAASGTVSLELAANATPMVIAYDMGWISRKLIGALMRIDTVTLVNLVSDTRAVPEFIGDNCRPAPIARAMSQVLAEPSAQLDAMRVTMERLGRGGEAPGLRAAKAILQGLEKARG